MGTRYIIRGRISDGKFREILRLFAEDLEAVKVARLTRVSRPSINRIFLALRERMAELCEEERRLDGVVEVDESYFGPRRVRGKRGRGAGRKIPVIGLLKRGGKVYTDILDDVSRNSLEAAIQGRVEPGSTIHTDGFKSYDGLVDLGLFKHHRIHHHRDEFARGANHINGIESFWGLAKVRFARLRGIPRRTFYLHLKEAEFRFNHRHENLFQILLKSVRNRPLKLS